MLLAVVCTVCGLPAFGEENPLILCDGCQAAVHADCYGITKQELEKEKWYCLACTKSVPARLSDGSINYARKCVACGHIGGALSITDDNQWIHTSCAMYNPLMKFKENSVSVPDKIKGKNKKCCICDTQFGWTRQCNYLSCHKNLHIHCGIRSMYYLFLL